MLLLLVTSHWFVEFDGRSAFHSSSSTTGLHDLVDDKLTCLGSSTGETGIQYHWRDSWQSSFWEVGLENQLHQRVNFKAPKNQRIWVFPKIGYPQIIHFNRVSIINHPFWGVSYFWKHPSQSASIQAINCKTLPSHPFQASRTLPYPNSLKKIPFTPRN